MDTDTSNSCYYNEIIWIVRSDKNELGICK